MSSSRKLLSPVDLETGKVRREFAVPDLGIDFGSRLVGLRSGRPCSHAYVVFTGTTVSAGEILERYREKREPARPESDCLALLQEYLEQVSNLSLGVVVEVAPAPAQSRFGLRVVRRSLPTKAIPVPP